MTAHATDTRTSQDMARLLAARLLAAGNPKLRFAYTADAVAYFDNDARRYFQLLVRVECASMPYAWAKVPDLLLDGKPTHCQDEWTPLVT